MHKSIAFSWLLWSVVIISTLAVQAKTLSYVYPKSWTQFEEDYPEAVQEWLEQLKNIVQVHEIDNVKRGFGPDPDLGFGRSRLTRPLLMKALASGLKRSDFMDMSSLARRRRSEQP